MKLSPQKNFFARLFVCSRVKLPDNSDCICGSPQGREARLSSMEARFSGPRPYSYEGFRTVDLLR